MRAQEERTWWQDFLGFVTFKPFGNNLCSPAASVWIFVARIAVFIMCTAESLAWSYVAYWFTTGSIRYVAAGAMFVAVFLLIAVVDSQFLTFDLHPRLYEIAGPKDVPKVEEQAGLRRAGEKIGGAALWLWRTPIPGFIVRVAMVIGSLIVSTDYLTMAVLAPDIEAKLQRDRDSAIAAKANDIAVAHDRVIAALRTDIAKLRNDVIAESAGVGATGRRGRGPTVRTMEARLTELQAEQVNRTRMKAEELNRYDSMSDAERAETYGVGAARTGGLQERSAALKELKKTAGFRESQLPIKAILAGIFLTIMVLKAFQRRTVSLYFSDRLQGTFTEYLEGAHDEWVPAKARAGGTRTMSPLEFEDWYKTTYARRERARKMETALDTVTAHYSAINIHLGHRLDAIAAELQPFEQDFADIKSEIVAKEDEIDAMDKRRNELKEIIKVNGEYQAELERLLEQDQQQAVGAPGARMYVRALRNQQYYVEQTAKMEEEGRTLSIKRDIFDRDRQALADERDQREQNITKKRQRQQALGAEREAARDEELKELSEIRRRFDGS
jgi:hypothetical protein